MKLFIFSVRFNLTADTVTIYSTRLTVDSISAKYNGISRVSFECYNFLHWFYNNYNNFIILYKWLQIGFSFSYLSRQLWISSEDLQRRCSYGFPFEQSLRSREMRASRGSGIDRSKRFLKHPQREIAQGSRKVRWIKKIFYLFSFIPDIFYKRKKSDEIK